MNKQNTMRRTTEPVLPTEVLGGSESGFTPPDEFWDAIYEFLQDKYGRDAGKYAQSYNVKVIVSDIEWEDMPKGEK